ncbi:MAG TPA: hypothetical protein VM571_01045 [Noviherbaspirillum sp.]|jgi:hypothetical protein|nr:hypothetical protein [Noviherbaspirillum sp.]
MQISELEQWLQGLPLDEPVDIDGESVYLRVEVGGAELGARFIDAVTGQQLQEAMKQGFQSAMEFDAGWGLSTDGGTLLLTQWLPGVSSWTEVPEQLEKLLNQVSVLRAVISPVKVKLDDMPNRDEQRGRSKLMGG